MRGLLPGAGTSCPSAGNAVAVTTTLNDSFGSRVTAEGLGFLLNDEMDDFTSKPGVPNTYGLIQGPANAIGPRKRPLSAMTPTIVLKDGKLFLVLGSPGGPTIITTVANILIGVVDFGLDIQEAIDMPRGLHYEGGYQLEDSVPAAVVEGLKKLGHKTTSIVGPLGGGQAIWIDWDKGTLTGGSDPRKDGCALGY